MCFCSPFRGTESKDLFAAKLKVRIKVWLQSREPTRVARSTRCGKVGANKSYSCGAVKLDLACSSVDSVATATVRPSPCEACPSVIKSRVVDLLDRSPASSPVAPKSPSAAEPAM
jgi:hypothetical protein